MTALQTILSPNVATRVVSRYAAASDWLANLFGVQPGGSNVFNEGHGRNGAYTIFNNTRAVAKGRAPGTAHGTSAAQGVGRVNFTFPRMHDSIPLLAETLHNLARIDNPTVRQGAYDDMVSRQQSFLGTKAANWRKSLLVGTLRDSLYVTRDGDDEFVTFANGAGAQRIHGRMPAGNKATLDMLGAGNIITASWATATTDIPLQLLNINAAFQQKCGGHLGAIICGKNVWNAVRNNDFVSAEHGTSTAPYRRFERDQLDRLIGNTTLNGFVAELNSMPGVPFFITDEGLDIGKLGEETYQKIVPDGKAVFVGFEPKDPTFGVYEGSEPIAEYDGAAESVKVGLASWMYKQANPTTTHIVALDNALPVNHVPASIAYADLIF